MNQSVSDCEVCQCIDGNENHGEYIAYEFIEDDSIKFYRCDIHPPSDDENLPEGWRSV